MMAVKNSAISSGVEYPTVSGRLIVVAPASMTASTTRHRKSRSLRVASSAENSTSSVNERARTTDSVAAARQASRVMRSLRDRWRSEVAMNVWMRPRRAGVRAQAARSMSPGAQRASAATVARSMTCATWRTASASSSDAMGKPASMMSTPKRLQLPGQPDLLVDLHREPRGLFAVPQGRVENDQPVSHKVSQCGRANE